MDDVAQQPVYFDGGAGQRNLAALGFIDLGLDQRGPVVGTLCATVVVGEIPRWQDYAAMACVLLAIAAVLLPSRQARAASPS